MAAKRVVKKKRTGVRKPILNPKKLKVPPLWFQSKHCTPQEVCKYIEDLNKWLAWFWTDYRNLRIAMCNVERKAFGDGISTIPKRFCAPGGPSDEPADPPKPPVWT